MRSRGRRVAAVVLAACAVAALSVPAALADPTGTSDSLSGLTPGELQSALNTWVTAMPATSSTYTPGTYPGDGSSYTNSDLASGALIALDAAGYGPNLCAMGRVDAGYSGFYTGWKYIDIGSGATVYRHVHSDTTMGSLASGAYTSVSWFWKAEGNGSPCVNQSQSATGFPTIGGSNSLTNVWVLFFNSGTGMGGTLSSSVFCDAGATTCPETAGPASGAVQTAIDNAANALVTAGVATKVYATGTPSGCAPAANCWELIRTPKQQRDATTVTDANLSDYNAAPDKVDGGVDAPGTVTSATVQAVLQACGWYSSSVGSRAQEACEALLRPYADGTLGGGSGGGGPPGWPKRLPTPTLNESGSLYHSVLTDSSFGWDGTYTSTDDTSLDATAGASSDYAKAPVGAVLAVATAGTDSGTCGTFVWLFSSVGKWSPPSMPYAGDPKVPVCVKVKGSSSSFGGGCDPTATICMPSFSGACDKFPFGAVCWFGGEMSAMFTATPTAPSVTWGGLSFGGAAHSPGSGVSECPNGTPTPGGGTNCIPSGCGSSAGTYAVGCFTFPDFSIPGFTLDAADVPSSVTDLITVIRDVLGFFVWVIGCWFLAKRLLKFGQAEETFSGVELFD